jgi:hypothetical protein
MKNYKSYLFPATIVLGCLLLWSIVYQKNNQIGSIYNSPTPSLKEDHGLGDKNRSWTEQEAQEYATNFELVQQSIEVAKSENKKTGAAFTDVSLFGKWKSKGPYNMPGSFQFCEVDEGTDTVYAVTCGHYGEVQFIWKGILAGDKWTLVNPKNPSRFEDLIVVPNGTNRRVIATHQKGKIMYTDNGGETWIYSTGVPSGIHSTIVNRQDNDVVYATDGKNVYKSTDKGTSFTSLQTIGSSASNARLYSPRWNIQPNAMDVYLAVDAKFYKLDANKIAFTQIGTFPTGGAICLGGDSRKLWMTLARRKWHCSTDGGITWKYQLTTNASYGTAENDMVVGQYPGVNPEDPNILIGGYTTPVSTRDGGVTTNIDAGKYWGFYQNSIGNDPKMRINYHPDIQGSQFFYDKAGKLYTLRSTDGGVFKSYNEWTKTSFPDAASIQNGIFYNISLFSQPSQETYHAAFVIGKNNVNDMTVGTQDQGEQNSRLNTYNAPMLSWDQVQGGDGHGIISGGDGLIGWSFDYHGTKWTRYELYKGTTYVGHLGNQSATVDVFTTNSDGAAVADWNNTNRVWILGSGLRRVEYNTTTKAITGKEDALMSGGGLQGLAQSRVNAAIVYALKNGTVFKSTDSGTNWSQFAPQSATGITGSGGMGWSSPLDENIILFATQSGTAVKTVLSKNGGTTWTNVTGTGANLFPSAEVNGMAGTTDGKLVFASTNLGPYVFIVSEEKWYPLAIDPKVPLFNGRMMYCQKYNGVEYARFSTWGQGVWDFEISSTTISIAEQNAENINVAIYPNPANDILHIDFYGKLAPNTTLSIYDELGKIVKWQKTKGGTETIDISNLKPGVYFVSTIIGKENVRKKFIKK